MHLFFYNCTLMLNKKYFVCKITAEKNSLSQLIIKQGRVNKIFVTKILS